MNNTELAPISAPTAGLASMTPAERINLHYRLANDNWQAALEHALLCGWELACQKNRVGWGGWKKWTGENLDFSKDTADRLIGFYEAKIGAERKRIGIALENDISPNELQAACGDAEGKSVTAAMIDAGVRSRSSNWGGDRRDAAAANGNRVGRPSKGSVGEQLDAAMDSATLAWKRIETHLEALDGYFPTAASVARLNDERLGRLFQVLFPLCEAAKKQLEARVKGNGKGLAGAFSAEPGGLHPGQANL